MYHNAHLAQSVVYIYYANFLYMCKCTPSHMSNIYSVLRHLHHSPCNS
jgi:hypothetical protein